MGCTGAGMVSILLLGVAVVLNVVSFILPLWTTSDVVNHELTSKMTSASFAAGVWGYCTDIEVTHGNDDKDGKVEFDHCYFFHTSNEYELPVADSKWGDNFASTSICDAYDFASTAGSIGTVAFTSSLALSAGMNTHAFGKFIERSCSALGSATLVFASLASSTGVLAFIGLVLGVTCCKNKSSFNAAVKVLISFAMVSTVLTFALWLAQSRGLGEDDDVSLSGSFILSVLSAVLFLISGVLLARHATMHK